MFAVWPGTNRGPKTGCRHKDLSINNLAAYKENLLKKILQGEETKLLKFACFACLRPWIQTETENLSNS